MHRSIETFDTIFNTSKSACRTCWGSSCLHDRFHDAQAHNLEDSAREAASAKISLRALANAAGEMERLGANCELVLFAINIIVFVLGVHVCVSNCELLMLAVNCSSCVFV